MQFQANKNKPTQRMLKGYGLYHNAQKMRFQDLHTLICAGVKKCLGNPQDYGFNHCWMNLDLVWRCSLRKTSLQKLPLVFYTGLVA
jgi:tricorn protease-like protein